MLAVLLAASTLFSTLFGGLFAIKNQDRLHRLLGFAAGAILGLVAFDLLPEIFELVEELGSQAVWPMLALVGGFLLFHIIEKSILIHHSQEGEYEVHKHPQVGMASAIALMGHSFLDGVAIGLAFQVDQSIGIAVAVAVIAHDFTDGINTASLMLVNKNTPKRTVGFLLMDAAAPILGAASTLLFHVSDFGLLIYLGFFAGSLLYIGASEILPEAHSKHSSYGTIALTLVGVLAMFLIVQTIE
ncbi:MAG TPA: ZIP family metal transporter [Candidatus Saccharimonadales bacterium]